MAPCGNCGATQPSEVAKFCTRCGTALLSRVVPSGGGESVQPRFRLREFLGRLLGRGTRSLSLPCPIAVPSSYWRRITARGRFRAPWNKQEIATFHKHHRPPDLSEVSASARKIYLYMFHIADDGGYCWPFYRTIASRTHLSATVGKALKELEAAGLVSHHQRASRRGASSNLYRVNVPR